jgi:mannose-6-phosphate isomerase-like protein (cupin superfamily)
MADDPTFALERFPLHLGRGGLAEVQPEHDGSMDWYIGYGERAAADGADGWLVSMHSFTEPWDSWEVHPNGHELVLCTAGEMTVHQEIDGVTSTVVLTAGEAVVNPPGAWHTADIEGSASAVFITSGAGTENRPR